MKYTFIILALSLILILIPSGCRNKKIESLERKNNQLLIQIDSLKLAIENQKKNNLSFRASARNLYHVLQYFIKFTASPQ